VGVLDDGLPTCFVKWSLVAERLFDLAVLLDNKGNHRSTLGLRASGLDFISPIKTEVNKRRGTELGILLHNRSLRVFSQATTKVRDWNEPAPD
jgi:hypothetical protein